MSTESVFAMMEVVGHAARQRPDIYVREIVSIVSRIGKVARQLHGRYEMECNGIGQHVDEEKFYARTEQLQKHIEEIGGEIDLKIEHQTDPRGWPVIVRVGEIETRLG